MTTRQRRQLRKRIEVQAGITNCQMKVVFPSSTHSSRVNAACLEALSQAQRYLADRMADSADALAGLDPSACRSWKASVGDAGQSLMLHSWRLDIRIAISRPDRQPVPEFSSFEQKTVELRHIEGFIEDWPSLHWNKVAFDGNLSVGQWVAERNGWRINVYGEPGSQLTHREVMLRWMGTVYAA